MSGFSNKVAPCGKVRVPGILFPKSLRAKIPSVLDTGITPRENLTKKQRKIWEYMRLCPDETNYSVIAKGAKVTRHTVSKHYELIQKMLGTKENAPLSLP